MKRAFGRLDSAENTQAIRFGLKQNNSEAVTNNYLNEIKVPLSEAGLRFPSLQQFDAAGTQLAPSTREIIASLQ